MVILHQDHVSLPSNINPSGWSAEDDRRLIRIRLRVANLQDAIQFYTSAFGLLLRQKLDLPGAPIQRAIVSDTIEPGSGFALELLETTSTTAAPSALLNGNGAHTTPTTTTTTTRTGLEHITLAVENTSTVLENLKTQGWEHLIINEQSAVIAVRNPTPFGGRSLTDQVALVQDLDGYIWQLMELKGSRPPKNRICTVALSVTDIDTSLQWYCDILGSTVNERYEADEEHVLKAHKSALIGWSRELEGTLLELRQPPPRKTSSPPPPPTQEEAKSAIQFVITSKDLGTTCSTLDTLRQLYEMKEIGSEVDPTKAVQAVEVKDLDGWTYLFVNS